METAADGLTALAAARARLPDLVLSDVMMPGLDGFQLLQELRRDPRTQAIPVILLSARAGEESKIEGLDAGADDYLIKPFSANELHARVNAHITLARARTALHRQIDAARAQAEAASHAKDEFLAMLGHELRNPLSALSAASQILDTAPLQQTGRALDVIRRQVRHLARLVDDLLDAGRVAMGKLVLNRQPLSLSAIIERWMHTMRAAGTLRHEVRLDLHPVWILGDDTRIEQLASNLLHNAMKFTPAGGQITVTVRAEGQEAVLRVEDTGAGIAPEILPRIFDLFAQGEASPDRASGGLGIGLTVVKRIAELHGGAVEAASPGRGLGSTLTVRLPQIEPPRAARETAPRAPNRGARRILVVEDNADAREMLATLLTLDGNEVHEAVDGPSGVAAALRLAPDVALIDLGLPGLDGYQVAEAIRSASDRPEMLLVALTGYGQPEDHERTRRAGFHAHLVKPVDFAQLDRIIEKAAPREGPSTR